MAKKAKKKKRPKKKLAESDLYPPIRALLLAQGYTVRGEVLDCDVAAVRPAPEGGDGKEELVIVEIKLSLSLDLLIQAARRQRITDAVYVAVPRPPKGIWTRRWRGIKHLLRRLELGLILVSFSSKKPPVEIVAHPVPFSRQKRKSKRRAVLREIAGRSGDFNRGGSAGRKLVTAYREQAIRIACVLERYGPLAPRQLRALGTGEKTLAILYNNVYEWFERLDRGLYGLRPGGRAALGEWPALVGRVRKSLAKIEVPA